MKSRVRLDLFNKHFELDRESSFVKEITWYLVKSFFILTPFPFPNYFKSFLLRLFGAKIGKGLIIKPMVNIHFPWKQKWEIMYGLAKKFLF